MGRPPFITGALLPFANTNTVPTGWLKADGAELSKAAYPALLAAVGTKYGETNGEGGVGTTHFRVPDLRDINQLHYSWFIATDLRDINQLHYRFIPI